MTYHKTALLTRRLRRLDLAMIIGLIAALLFTDLCSFGRECDVVRRDVVRLHIVANSDADDDQRVKLLVRDAILEQLGPLFETPRSQLEAKQLAASELMQVERIAREVLKVNGVSMPVNASVRRMYFPTREYDGFTLPAGQYDAVRVSIGSGSGHNWWCVMYPPLCIPAASDSQQAPAKSSSGAEHAKQEIDELNSQPHLEPKLAVVEAFESIFS